MREKDIMFQDAGSQDSPAFQTEEATRAIYLGFDNANYIGGKSPCQALPALLKLKEIKFFKLHSDGDEWKMNRADVIERMEKGEYLWVSSEERKTAASFCGWGYTYFQIKTANDISLYWPEFKPPFSERAIESLLGKPAGSFFFKGRMRKYKQDGSVSKGQNYSTANKLNAQRIADREGNQ